MSDDIEQMIKDAGADKAPRITPQHIEAQIHSEHYLGRVDIPGRMEDTSGMGLFTATALGCLTICVLVLKNGFTVVGTSACASPENFNEEIGRRIARDEAFKQIWAHEGYQLRSFLAGRLAATICKDPS